MAVEQSAYLFVWRIDRTLHWSQGRPRLLVGFVSIKAREVSASHKGHYDSVYSNKLVASTCTEKDNISASSKQGQPGKQMPKRLEKGYYEGAKQTIAMVNQGISHGGHKAGWRCVILAHDKGLCKKSTRKNSME